jgi:glucokinase
VKSSFAPCYEVYPSEGGHVDFPARSDEDMELIKFAYNFVEHSNNVENLRGKCKPTRISIERVCAGPAIPMIYEFYKTKIPAHELARTLEEGELAKTPDEITSVDIVKAGLRKDNPDMLC